MGHIATREWISELKEIANNYPLRIEDVVLVPSVQEWAHAQNLAEPNPFRAGCVVRNNQSGEFLVVLAAEITTEMQSSVVAAMELNGFADEVKRLAHPRSFLFHLFLHELAHAVLATTSEERCDEWAFRELERYAA